MYLKSLHTIFFITLFFSINCFAQISPDSKSEKWTRIETAAQELSLTVPPNFIVDAEKKKFGPIYKITGFSNGVIMEISVNKSTSGREFTYTKPPTGTNSRTLSKKDLNGIRFSSNSSGSGLKENISISGDKNSYYISITASDRTKPEIDRFLFSIKLKGEALFQNPNASNYPESTVALSSLESSPEVIEALKRKLEKKKFEVEKIISTSDYEINSYAEYSRPPIVVEQIYPEFRPRIGGMNSNVFLSARLKLTLSADGQIGNITVISGSNDSYTDSCVDAARKLRFIPAQKNGVNVDSVKIIDFAIQTFATAPFYIP